MFGKRTDVVDFGGEMDYSETKWFQDAPPRRHTVRPLALTTWRALLNGLQL